MDSTALLVIVVALSGGAGWAAGRLLHRRPAGLLLDGLQGTCGALLGLELDAWLSSSRPPGPVELSLVALIGARRPVGVVHATAAML